MKEIVLEWVQDPKGVRHLVYTQLDGSRYGAAVCQVGVVEKARPGLYFVRESTCHGCKTREKEARERLPYTQKVLSFIEDLEPEMGLKALVLVTLSQEIIERVMEASCLVCGANGIEDHKEHIDVMRKSLAVALKMAQTSIERAQQCTR